MARNLLKRFNNVNEYNRVKCTLDIKQISLINTYKETKYGAENYTITSVYNVRNKSNKINLFNNATLVNSMSRMYINGIEVEPTNEFQFDEYENATIECEFCNLTSIPNNAFSGCIFLKSITIPSGVTSIGNSAFRECYSLTSITIPNSVTSIGDYAFIKCRSLSEITIPSGVTSIGYHAFFDCFSLSNITIPSGVTSIGNYVFSDCKSLTSIEIPSGVTSIGDYAFRYCRSLSEITCLAETAPTVSSNTFYNILSLGVLYYPGLNSSYDAWKQYLPNWDFIPLYTPQE